jgi:hypothetical protein
MSEESYAMRKNAQVYSIKLKLAKLLVSYKKENKQVDLVQMLELEAYNLCNAVGCWSFWPIIHSLAMILDEQGLLCNAQECSGLFHKTEIGKDACKLQKRE